MTLNICDGWKESTPKLKFYRYDLVKRVFTNSWTSIPLQQLLQWFPWRWPSTIYPPHFLSEENLKNSLILTPYMKIARTRHPSLKLPKDIVKHIIWINDNDFGSYQRYLSTCQWKIYGREKKLIVADASPPITRMNSL